VQLAALGRSERYSARALRPWRALAEALNARGIATARGGRWQAMTVSNVLSRGVTGASN
jgi:hypothetical protein